MIEKQKFLQNIVERKKFSLTGEQNKKLQRLRIVMNKDREQSSSSESQIENEVRDGFYIPLSSPIVIKSDYFFQLTKSGSFRISFMRLLEKDLYLYPSDQAEVVESMIVLMAGVQILKRGPIST